MEPIFSGVFLQSPSLTFIHILLSCALRLFRDSLITRQVAQGLKLIQSILKIPHVPTLGVENVIGTQQIVDKCKYTSA